MVYVLLMLLFFSILSEGTVTSLPLVLVSLLCLTILTRDSIVFFAAFVAGILLDVFALRPLGETSIFLLTFVLLILLYQGKYEIYSYQFVIFAAFIGGLFFLGIFGSTQVLLNAIVGAIVAACFFALIKLFVQRQADDEAARRKHYNL
ncbi:MAG: hypothetical protein ACR2LN_05920 [Candidatus Levyibacteriota bacterium]